MNIEHQSNVDRVSIAFESPMKTRPLIKVEELNPLEYFSGNKKANNLNDSDFDKGLFKEFFDKSMREVSSSAQNLADDYEVVQLNQSIHMSVMMQQPDENDDPRLSLMSNTQQLDPHAQFLSDIRKLIDQVSILRIDPYSQNCVRNLLESAHKIAKQEGSDVGKDIQTFGQFLKKRHSIKQT